VRKPPKLPKATARQANQLNFRTSPPLLRPLSCQKSHARKTQFRVAVQADLGGPVLRAKIFRFPCPFNWWLLASSRLDKRGVRVVTNARWDAMDAAVSKRRATLRRTAKSCGPGAPTLALSLWDGPQVTVAKEPGHRGEHEGNR
jgi:hypothetical protein